MHMPIWRAQTPSPVGPTCCGCLASRAKVSLEEAWHGAMQDEGCTRLGFCRCSTKEFYVHACRRGMLLGPQQGCTRVALPLDAASSELCHSSSPHQPSPLPRRVNALQLGPTRSTILRSGSDAFVELFKARDVQVGGLSCRGADSHEHFPVKAHEVPCVNGLYGHVHCMLQSCNKYGHKL